MVNKVTRRLTSEEAIGIAYPNIPYITGSPLSRDRIDSDSLTRTHLAYARRLSTTSSMIIRADANTLHLTRYARAPWRRRSEGRFLDGTYKEIKFWDLGFDMHPRLFFDHYVHIDPTDGTKVRYFASEEHAIADRHTSTTLGRYLTEFYSNQLGQDEIRDIAAAFTAGKKRCAVTFLRDEDAIVDAYVSGPSSCMSKPSSAFVGERHPTRVYGEGDLSLAILKKNGSITARGLVWEDKKLYGRLYGDVTELRHQLKGLGYQHGSFHGARIAAEWDSNTVAYGPYIDAYNPSSDCSAGGAAYVVEDDGYLMIWDQRVVGTTPNYGGQAHNTDGSILVKRSPICPVCKKRRAEISPYKFFSVTNGDPSLTRPCMQCREKQTHTTNITNIFVYHWMNETVKSLELIPKEYLGWNASECRVELIFENDEISMLDEQEYPPVHGVAQFGRDSDTTDITIEGRETTVLLRDCTHTPTILLMNGIIRANYVMNRHIRQVFVGSMHVPIPMHERIANRLRGFSTESGLFVSTETLENLVA